MEKNNGISSFAPDEVASWDYAQIWDKFPVPARPSKEELAYLEKDITGKKENKNLLILGSTIEYRSLAKKLGITSYVADFEKSYYEILTKYTDEKFENEHFLETDWLDIDDVDKYDVIIGHRPINVIGQNMLNKFFKVMYCALKPGGVFYCKGNVKYMDDKDRLDELLEKWAFKKDREYPLFSYIEVELYFRCADKDGYVDYSKARKLVNEWFESKKISEKDHGLTKLLVSMSSEARFRGTIYEDEVKLALKDVGFSKEEWITLDKDICQNMPIIRLKK